MAERSKAPDCQSGDDGFYPREGQLDESPRRGREVNASDSQSDGDGFDPRGRQLDVCAAMIGSPQGPTCLPV